MITMGSQVFHSAGTLIAKLCNHELRSIKFKFLHIQIPRQIVTFGMPLSQLVAKIHSPNNNSSAATFIGSIAVNNNWIGHLKRSNISL